MGKIFRMTTEELVALAVTTVQRLAVDGVAPGQREYNQRRVRGAPSTSCLMGRGIEYGEVVRRAGLIPLGHGRRGASVSVLAHARAQWQAGRSGVPAAVEAEIQQAFAAQEETAAWLRAWPMKAIPTRLEVREMPLADGSGVLRVTRAYASLR